MPSFTPSLTLDVLPPRPQYCDGGVAAPGAQPASETNPPTIAP